MTRVCRDWGWSGQLTLTRAPGYLEASNGQVTQRATIYDLGCEVKRRYCILL